MLSFRKPIDPRSRRTWFGALVAMSVAALAALLAFEMPSKVTIPVALLLTAAVIWTSIRRRRRSIEEEVGVALRQWVAKSGDEAGAADLRRAFSNHFAGRRQLLRDADAGRELLEAAVTGFSQFLDGARTNGAPTGLGGLIASSQFHRAASRRLLADVVEDSIARRDLIEKAITDLVDFADKHARWPLLIPGALSLRLRCRLELGDFDAAEKDQQALDRIPGSASFSPEVLATRVDLGDALWEQAEAIHDAEESDTLRHRALAHYDAWLNQLGSGHLAAKLRVARRNSQIDRSDRVIAVLKSELSEGQGSSRRDQLEANRLLARAYLLKGQEEKALRAYSVLMSISGPDNPWFRDPEVLREISRAEKAVLAAEREAKAKD